MKEAVMVEVVMVEAVMVEVVMVEVVMVEAVMVQAVMVQVVKVAGAVISVRARGGVDELDAAAGVALAERGECGPNADQAELGRAIGLGLLGGEGLQLAHARLKG